MGQPKFHQMWGQPNFQVINMGPTKLYMERRTTKIQPNVWDHQIFTEFTWYLLKSDPIHVEPTKISPNLRGSHQNFTNLYEFH